MNKTNEKSNKNLDSSQLNISQNNNRNQINHLNQRSNIPSMGHFQSKSMGTAQFNLGGGIQVHQNPAGTTFSINPMIDMSNMQGAGFQT